MDIYQNHSDSPNRADESSTLINSKAQPDNSNNGPSPDQLFLSPIEKFAIYNKFPFNLIVHFLLVVGTTYQLMIINTTYPRSQERALYQMFIEENDKTNFEYKRTKYLYSLDDVKKLLNDSIYNYYGIKDSSFETVKFYNDNLPPSPFISANYYKSKNGKKQNITYYYEVNKTSLGVFDNDTLAKEFIAHITSFQVNYTIQTYIPFYYADYLDCYTWTIKQIYSFQQRAHIRVSLLINRNLCNNENPSYSFWQELVAEYLWVHSIVFLLAFISLLFTLRHFYQIAERSQEEISGSSFITKIKGLDTWSIASLSGNVVQMFGCGLSLFDTDNVISATEIAVATGCFFAYINIGKYMENLKNYSMIFLTIKKALPNSINYLVGVSPLFFGYAFFGLCVFWESERFDSLWNSIATLYSIMNGDSVLDIIDDLQDRSFFLGTIYVYSFCIVFIAIVVNTFFAIISEVYVSRKMNKHKHWIFAFLRNEAVDEKEDEIELDSDGIEEKITKNINQVKTQISQTEKLSNFVMLRATNLEKVKLSSKFIDRINSIKSNVSNLKEKVYLLQ